jgi:uncharacterized protein (DUF2237 family)
VADRLSQSDLATLSLLDPDQGVCPSGHACLTDTIVGYRRCSTCDYAGFGLICWQITTDDIDFAASDGADARIVEWARSFEANRSPA